jgi:hypothetical protein
VGADGERLDEGELVVVERGGLVEFARGDGDEGAHAAVDVDAHDLEVGAAIRFAAAAGDALAAVDVGFNGAAVASFEAVRFGAGIDDLDAEFVSADARVIKERLFTGEGVKICTANADTVDAHERFAGGECGLGGVVGGGELARVFEGNLEHLAEREKRRKRERGF